VPATKERVLSPEGHRYGRRCSLGKYPRPYLLEREQHEEVERTVKEYATEDQRTLKNIEPSHDYTIQESF
jgi:hypothetical protein